MTTSSGSASERTRARIGGWLAPATIALLCVIAPAFATDDTKFFNYLNNVDGALPLYYYNGYVPVLPELASFALKLLPLALQAAAYRIVPLLTMLLLYQQLRKLLVEKADAGDASIIALAVTIVIGFIDRDLGANLTFAPWSALLAAIFFIVRDRPGPYSWVGAAGVFIAAVSLPIGLLLVPVLLARRRSHDGVLAAVILGVHVLVIAGSPESVLRITNPAVMWSMFISGFRAHKLANLIALASLAATLVSCALVWRRGANPRARHDIWALAFIGIASVLAYPFSDRFPLYDGGFEMRYTLPAFACAAAVSALALSAIDIAAHSRTLVVGMMAGAALALLVAVEYSSLRGPLELALMKYRFLQVGADFRSHCRDGEVFLFEDDDTSPVLLCRPRAFAPGFVAVSNAAPTIGAASVRDKELPGIFVPEPLF